MAMRGYTEIGESWGLAVSTYALIAAMLGA
jgi:hypothetical protein